MRKTILVAVAGAALVAPGAAVAKEVSAAKLCGPSGCTTLTDKTVLTGIVQFHSQPVPVAPPAPASYYRVTFLIHEPGHGTFPGVETWWSPAAAKIRGSNESGAPFWYDLTAEQQQYLRRGTESLTPYPTPRLTQVLVGTRRVRDPNSYLALLYHAWPVATDYADDWKPVTITATRRNPWTDRTIVLYSPDTNSLWRAAERLRVPDGVASDVEARRSLTAGGGRSYAWAWVAGAAAILGVAGMALRRRR